MQRVKLGDVEVTRFILGGNPFSGFSHQSPQRDREMVRYYTVDRIKETLRKAEAAGINTVIGRSDNHIKRLLWEYWDEGGQIQWIAQTASELGDQLRAVRDVEAHAWIRDNLQPDFQMCCYYDPSPRGDSPHHVGGHQEKWDKEHRAEMAALISTLPWPAIHYKVFAGGNHSIEEGWQFVAQHLRPDDLVCIGHYLGDNPDMIAENVATFEGLTE
jgi:hypothetical protein